VVGRLREASDAWEGESVAVLRNLGDPVHLASGLPNLGSSLVERGRAADGLPHLLEAMQIAEADGGWIVGAVRGSLAVCLANVGRHDEARELAAAGLAALDPRGVEYAKSLVSVAVVEGACGDYAAAARVIAEAEAAAASLGDSDPTATSPRGLGTFGGTWVDRTAVSRRGSAPAAERAPPAAA
jgi:Flp pilus assembly protein TadD